MVVFLAISSGFFYGVSNLLTRIGLRYSNPLSAVLINQVSGLVACLFIYCFALSLDPFDSKAILYFIAAGIMGPFIARFFLYIGIDKVGTSIASALYQTKPLFSALTAVMILSEKITLPIAAGMFLMTLGTVIISVEESGGQIEKKWVRRDLIFPLAAGAFFGLAHVVRKMGLNITPQPIMGVTVQSAAALFIFLLYTVAKGNIKRMDLNDKKAWMIFSISGLSSVTAQMCLFYALNLGQVVVVSPLASLEPFFVLFLVGIFLKKMERVTGNIVLGTILIFGGAVVLTLMF